VFEVELEDKLDSAICEREVVTGISEPVAKEGASPGEATGELP